MKTTNYSEIATSRNTVAILGEYQNNSEDVGVFTCARHGEGEKKTEKKPTKQKNPIISQVVIWPYLKPKDLSKHTRHEKLFPPHAETMLAGHLRNTS